MDKIEKLKKFLQKNYPNIQAFSTRNISGDYMENVYDEDDIQVDYCPNYEYIEIFGLSDKEFESLLTEGHLKTFSEYEKQNKMDIQVGDRVTLDCMGNIKTIIITREQEIEQIKENVAIYTNKILKIERPKYKVVEEKKELLTEEEREFLKQYIKMSPINIKYIEKEFNLPLKDTSITIILNDGKGTVFYTYYATDYFKNLEEKKKYTLKELGLEEN